MPKRPERQQGAITFLEMAHYLVRCPLCGARLGDIRMAFEKIGDEARSAKTVSSTVATQCGCGAKVTVSAIRGSESAGPAIHMR